LLTKNDFEREIFNLSDGGLLGFDWYYCPAKDSKKKDLNKEYSERPLVAIVPGLTGDCTKMYMISLVKAAC
jgi:predicted alpha/beta-fold hydrolase